MSSVIVPFPTSSSEAPVVVEPPAPPSTDMLYHYAEQRAQELGYLDPYVWRAHFANGTVLDEYDADEPRGRGFADIQQVARRRKTRLAGIELYPTREGLLLHSLATSVTAGLAGRGALTPVVLRRRPVVLDPNTEVATPLPAITIVGFERKDKRVPHGRRGIYLFLFADGSVSLTDDFQRW